MNLSWRRGLDSSYFLDDAENAKNYTEMLHGTFQRFITENLDDAQNISFIYDGVPFHRSKLMRIYQGLCVYF